MNPGLDRSNRNGRMLGQLLVAQPVIIGQKRRIAGSFVPAGQDTFAGPAPNQDRAAPDLDSASTTAATPRRSATPARSGAPAAGPARHGARPSPSSSSHRLWRGRTDRTFARPAASPPERRPRRRCDPAGSGCKSRTGSVPPARTEDERPPGRLWRDRPEHLPQIVLESVAF